MGVNTMTVYECDWCNEKFGKPHPEMNISSGYPYATFSVNFHTGQLVYSPNEIYEFCICQDCWQKIKPKGE